jgi:ABC-2 type transport system permease protein
MIEALSKFWLLLGPKARGFVRLGSVGEARNPLRLIFFLGLGLLFAVGIYLGSAWFLRQCLDVELVGALIPRKLMSLVLLILTSILLISTTISSFSVLFLSDDLGLLFSSPVPLGPLYYARFVEMVLHSSWMVIFFGLPVFLAYGEVYGASLGYYVAVALLFPGLILIPGALGAMIASVLTRIFSARRSRDLLIVLVIAAFVFLYLVIRAMRPEQLLEEQGFGSMMEFLNIFRAPESPYLPTLWMTDALFPVMQSKPVPIWLPVLGVWSTAAALVAISGWVCTALYSKGFARAQEGRTRSIIGTSDAATRGRVLGGWLDRLGGLTGFTGKILVKDLRVFFRDTNQWLQLLLLGALAAVYLLNFVYLKVANFSWFTLYTVNHVLMGLVLSGIAVRFVYPAVSLEGRAFWVIRSAPVDLSAFMHSKLLVHFVPLATLGVMLSVLSCSIIGVPFAFTVLSVALILILSLGVCTLGVGVGALHPRFNVENPAKIPTGLGGVTFMITSMGFVVAFLLTSFYPTFILFRWPRKLHDPITKPAWFWASIVFSALLAVAVTWIPMYLGRRKLQQRED